MAAYYTALVLTLLSALWLTPGARGHVFVLSVWLGVSVLLDMAQASELKLFVDFFGFLALAWLTITQAMAGKFTHGKNLCALLAFVQISVSATAYSMSYGFGVLKLPYAAFDVLLNTFGASLNALFLASGLALFIGEGGVRERVFDTIRSLGGLRLRRPYVPAPQKAYVKTPNSGLDFS